MSIKLFEMEGFLRGKFCPCDMNEGVRRYAFSWRDL